MTTARAALTGTQVVQQLPWKWGVQGKIFVVGGLGFMFDAWDVLLNAFIFPLIATEWSLSAAQLGVLGTMNIIGMAIGAITLSSLADVYGRKKIFTYCLLAFSLLSLLSAAAPNYEVFLILRFLTGIGLGGTIPVDYAIVGEFTPARVRGRVLTAMDAWWPVGGTLCGLVAAFLTAQGIQNWRYQLLFMVLPALLVVWIRRGIPESPMYLQRHGREQEARAIIDDMIVRTGAPAQDYVMDEPGRVEARGPKAASEKVVQLWRFSASRTFVSWMLFSSVLFVYYGALIWLPKILRDTKYSEYVAFMVTTGVTAVGIVGVLASAYLVDWFGRKPVIFGSAVLTAATLILFATYIDAPGPAKFWILAFGIVIEFCIPAIYAYVSELYPTELRASGFGWASSMSRFAAAIVPVAFGAWLFPQLGYVWTFVVATAFLVVSAVLMMFMTPETKGQELH
ncbi:MFS transporter [Cumulibacter manganitolerans]|uniref:MFS transporter n=1 Tax=Cumulibacter manganitolerans TaxID=1884992 RepID=UPI0012970BFE|nr:MFS transporter [Cumulibacter manganitolerans]